MVLISFLSFTLNQEGPGKVSVVHALGRLSLQAHSQESPHRLLFFMLLISEGQGLLFSVEVGAEK